MGAAERQSLDVCAGCGRMFVRETLQLCPNCATSEAYRFALVREFLRSNGRRSITEVADATGLPRGEVGMYIMQGRLIEVDPDTGRPRAEALRNPADIEDQLQDEAERSRARRQQRRLNMANEAPTAGEEDDRVRYIRRKRREEDE